MHAYDASETFFFLSWPWDPGYEAEKEGLQGWDLSRVEYSSGCGTRFQGRFALLGRYPLWHLTTHASLFFSTGDGPPLYIVSVAHTEQ